MDPHTPGRPCHNAPDLYDRPVSAGRRWPSRRTAGHEVKLTVLRDGVGRDYRGRNGQRRLATGTVRARDAARSRPARSADKSWAAAMTRRTRQWGEGIAALVKIW